MLEIIKTTGQVLGYITTIATFILVVLNPIKAIRNGQKCLLRHNMLHTYYKHLSDKTIRQYEFEDFDYQYKAYKALKGNSFIDKIYEEVKSWKVIS